MLKNKILFVHVLIVFCIFFISIAIAGENATSMINDNEVKNKTQQKIETGLLEEKQHANRIAAQSQDKSLKKVVFKLTDTDTSHITYLKENGAVIEAVHEHLVQASVPADRLVNISNLPFVDYVRAPRIPRVDAVISEGVGAINATALQNSGLKGQGVKIAILDVGFYGYQSKLGTELPTSVNISSFWVGGNIESGGNHGTAVAEVIYDIAPAAQLYLINFGTDMEFYDAVNYAINQNVDIISMSLNWLDIPADGTSQISTKVNSAASGGIIWVNSAGNYAKKHWEGNFNSVDANGIHNIINLPSSGEIDLFLSWDDPAQDYHMCVDRADGTGQTWCSTTKQYENNEPYEIISQDVPGGIYNIKINNSNATKDVTFHLFSANQDLEYSIPSHSIVVPADAQGTITVGSISLDNTLEGFSSQGPTIDGRIKPDIMGPDGVSTSVNGHIIFTGTSASTPHIAGAAALLKSMDISIDQATLRQALESTSIDIGAQGKDNVYGSGRIDVWQAALRLDKKPPLITIASPINGTRFNQSLITINGTASDNIAISKVEVRAGAGAWQTASGTSSWNSTVALSAGMNTIYARVTDASGNSDETSLTITLDTANPVITITSPVNGQKVNSSVLNVTGSASDNGRVEVRVGEGAWQTATGTSSWNSTVVLSAGMNTMYARVTDTLGASNETSVTITLDNINPVITITSPVDGQRLNSSVLNVTGSASDNDAIYKVEVRAGTGAWQTATGTLSWNSTVTLFEGTNTINARTIDDAGNIHNASVYVIVDTATPNLTISYPKEGMILNVSAVNVTGTVSDNYAKKVEVKAGNASWQIPAGETSWSIAVTLSEGLNMISARASDITHINETAVNVTLDTTKPQVTDLTLSTPTQAVNNSVDIKARVIDEYLDPSNISVQVESPDGILNKYQMKKSSETGVFSYTYNNISMNGKYNLTIIARDIAGNINDTEKTWFEKTNPYENNSVNIIQNNSTEINALENANTIIELFGRDTISGFIRITMSSELPSELNPPIQTVAFKKYISINLSNNLVDSFYWMNIKVFYTEDELKASGLDEHLLKISYYNESAGQWETLAKGSPSWVNDIGADSTNLNNFSGYVRVNLSRHSTLAHFAIVGNPAPAETTQSRVGGGSSSGGGGGGGGSSGESYSNIEVNEKYDLPIYKDKVTSFAFTHINNPIMYVNITGNVSTEVITAFVETLKGTSTLVTSSPPGIVYKNINIWVGSSGFAIPRNIKKGIVMFRVRTSWIKSNNLDGDDVKLLRWDRTKWITLETTQNNEDDTYTYFNSNSTSFSPFAISGFMDTTTSNAVQQMSFEPKPAANVTDTAIMEKQSEDLSSKNFAIIFVVFAIMGIVMGIHFKRKGNIKK